MNIPAILHDIAQLGLQINYAKSILHPVHSLFYLGLAVDTLSQMIRPTASYLQHLRDLISVVPVASVQDLASILGYVTWRAFAMRGPIFVATLVRA
jgi:hypothetical protein